MIEQMKSGIVAHKLRVHLSVSLQVQFATQAASFALSMRGESQSSGYYRKERSAHERKVLEDIQLSKYSEWIVAYGLTKIGFPRTEPGMEIRTNSQKGWEPDLTYPENPDIPDLHLKNTPAIYRKRMSWTFQWKNKSGKGGTDPLFKNPDSNDIVILTYVPNINSRTGVIMYSSPWRLLYPLLKDPMFPKYKGIKKCIYEDDLQKCLGKTVI